METAKKALIMFLKSLPEKSKFSVIGFGSKFLDYFGILNYDQHNLNLAIKKIKTLDADLNGTYILKPLQYVFEIKGYDKMAKNVFLLTDGKVNNSVKCIDSIRENVKSFRIHSFGIGTGVSSSFIKECGEVGKGTFNFAPDLKDIKKQVIGALNKSMRLYYTDLAVLFDDKAFKPIIQYPSSKFPVIYLDEIINYSFITEKPLDIQSNISITM